MTRARKKPTGKKTVSKPQSDNSDTTKNAGEAGEVAIIRGTKEAMLYALERANGIVTTATKHAGISRDTHYRWLKEDAQYAEACDMAKEIALDFVESKLMALINGVTVKDPKNGTVYQRPPDTASVIFYLKTKGKHRGYVERSEIVNTDVIIEIEGTTIISTPNDAG